MPGALVLGLILQGSAVVLFVLATRRTALRRPAFYFVAVAVVFTGGAEIVRLATGATLSARSAGLDRYVGQWNALVGVALVLFVVGYVMVGRRRRTTSPPVDGQLLAKLDWRVLVVPTVVLVYLAGSGQYSVYTLDLTTTVQTQTRFISQFVTPMVMLTGIAFVARHPRWFLPIYLLELLAILQSGQRLDIITVAVGTVVGLAILGRAPRVAPVVLAILCAVVVGASLDAARDHFGRADIATQTSVPARLRLVGIGFVDLVERTPAAYPTASEALAERLDGNSFPAGVLRALDTGVPTVGVRTIGYDLQLTVPSFVDPGKTSGDPVDRVEKVYLNSHFSLGYQTDFLPTQLGSALGYGGLSWLLVLTFLGGLFFGMVERFVLERIALWSFLSALALISCALYYERGIDTYFLQARGFLVIWAGLGLVEFLRRRVPSVHARTRPNTATRRLGAGPPSPSRVG